MGYAVKAPLKRGGAMRTSNNANPIEDIVYNMHKASPKKHAGVLSYISTGVDTYAPEAYTGFQKAAKGNDMIDAYLYNKTINPSYGVKKINVAHENYIRKIYPYKDIPVYENTETLDFFTKKPMQKWSSYDLDSKAVLGLKILDKLGTPVIVWLLLTMIQYMIIGMKMDQIKSLLKLILIKLIVSIGLGSTYPAKYKEMPTAKKISIPKQEEETVVNS